MKKSRSLILQIPEPCHEKWEEMSVMDKGRFCTHCQKTVTDIRTMSDQRIAQLFQNSAEAPCIRASRSQLNRNIILPPQPPTRFYRIAVALGLVLVSATTTDSIAHSKAPLTEQNSLGYEEEINQNPSTGGGGADSIMVEGVVFDHANKPIENAMVRLQDGSRKNAITDEHGIFCISALNKYDAKRLFLSINANGYEGIDISISYEEMKSAAKINVSLERIPADDDIMGKGLGNVFYRIRYDDGDGDEIEDKDSLGHIPAIINPPANK